MTNGIVSKCNTIKQQRNIRRHTKSTMRRGYTYTHTHPHTNTHTHTYIHTHTHMLIHTYTCPQHYLSIIRYRWNAIHMSGVASVTHSDWGRRVGVVKPNSDNPVCNTDRSRPVLPPSASLNNHCTNDDSCFTVTALRNVCLRSRSSCCARKSGTTNGSKRTICVCCWR